MVILYGRQDTQTIDILN